MAGEGESAGLVIGRSAEAEHLAAFLDGALERGGALVLIGDVGVGKSMLLNAATDLADRLGAARIGSTWPTTAPPEVKTIKATRE